MPRQGESPRRGRSPRRAAVIDLGSLAVRLHVAEAASAAVAPDPFRSLLEERRIARLADGLAAGGDLSAEGRRRVLDILLDFRSAVERLGVDPRLTRVAATAAMREARGGAEFAKRIEAETGFPVCVLSAEEEARWTARGALLAASALPRPVLIADPGGGSVELIWVEGDREDGEVRCGSEPLGVLGLLHRFPLGAPADSGLLKRLEREVARGVGRLMGRVRPPGGRAASLLITGGTALNLAAMSRRIPPADVRVFRGTVVSGEELEAMYRRLAASDLDARKREPCLERGREDVIVPGLAVLRGLLLAGGTGSLAVTPFGLREGILDALLQGKEVPGGIRGTRRNSRG